MTAKEISGFLFASFCIAVILTAGLLASGAAQSYYYPYSNNAPQTAQDREELFKAFQNIEKNNTSQAIQLLAYPYSALQNPYAFQDPQAALNQASAYKAIQKLNSVYQNPQSEDNWYYWADMWLNSPQGGPLGAAGAYNALQNPYVYQNPQAALDQADAYKVIQKLNDVYQNPLSEDNWYYWSNMWLNGP